MTTLLTAIIAGLVGGLGARFIWEGVLKPNRDRRNLAAALAEEISLNVNRLAAFDFRARAKPSALRRPPRMSSGVFSAAVGRLGELRHYDIGRVVELYGVFAAIDEAAVRDTDRPGRKTDDESAELIKEFLHRQTEFVDQLGDVIALCYTTLDGLGENGAPEWTRRRWRPNETPRWFMLDP